MLVITRKKGESILIGDNIELTLVSVDDGNVKIAINAPKEIKILRKELIKEVKDENLNASKLTLETLEKLKSK